MSKIKLAYKLGKKGSTIFGASMLVVAVIDAANEEIESETLSQVVHIYDKFIFEPAGFCAEVLVYNTATAVSQVVARLKKRSSARNTQLRSVAA